jgi:riboflavin synthase
MISSSKAIQDLGANVFTGIVEEVGVVKSFNGSRLVINARKALEGLALGDSISINGACLTVVAQDRASFSIDAVPETLRRTNLGGLKRGDPVNLERALAAGGRLGGHIVQGHVDARGWLLSIKPEGDARIFRFRAPKRLVPYIVEKGFIAIDGVSLTVVKRFSTSFTISVIPYTFANTNFERRRPGDLVNLEVDILAKYVESLLASRQ